MAVKKYYDSDCNIGMLDGKTVAVIGFGSQGHAHSENLAESGVNVVVGLRKGSAHWEKAAKFAETCPNFHVMEVEESRRKQGQSRDNEAFHTSVQRPGQSPGHQLRPTAF